MFLKRCSRAILKLAGLAALFVVIAAPSGGGGSGGGSSCSGGGAVTHEWLNSLSSGCAATLTRPACGDLSNAAASCSTDATNASNISSGTLSGARLPTPTSSVFGGVTATTSQMLPPVSANFASGLTLSAINKLDVYGLSISSAVTFSHISYAINTADNSANLYDLGLYNSAGTLIADIGATAGTTFSPSTGWKTIATVQGSQTISPGFYYMAFTGNATTAKLWGAGQVCTSYSTGYGTSSGGALPSSITAPGLTLTAGTTNGSINPGLTMVLN